MVARSVGIIAATALTAANAFLLPPSISSADIPIGIAIVKPNSQSVNLPCGDCVKKTETSEAASANLVVNITTLLNGYGVGLPESYALYPPLQSYLKPTIEVVQSSKSGDTHSNVQVTADATIISEEPSPDGESLIKIEYQISAIDHSDITVRPIHITAIKAKDNTVSILTVIAETEEDDKNPAGRPKKECHLPAMLCHLHEMIDSSMSKIKETLPDLPGLRRPDCVDGIKRPNVHGGHGFGSAHVLPSHIRPHFTPLDHNEEGKPADHRPMHGPPHGSPHHGGPRFGHHRPHMRHHRQSMLMRVLKTVTIVLVPILLGITMGIFVSFIGMLVGRLVVFVWVRFFRGGKRGYASVRLNEEEAEAEEGKAGEDVESVAGETPPLYEDVPEYSEKASL